MTEFGESLGNLRGNRHVPHYGLREAARNDKTIFSFYGHLQYESRVINLARPRNLGFVVLWTLRFVLLHEQNK